MANDPSNARLWLHGLGAAAISALASAISGAVALPEFFNFSHHGLVNTAKLVVVPTVLATALYLKQSPLPASSITATETKTTTVDVTKQ